MEAKKIIITGGATRICSAIAKSLAGYDVDIVIHFNKSKKSAQKLKAELEEIGSKVHLIKDFKRYVKNKEANIINIIDQRVKKLTPFFFSYTLSKAALATLTTTTAMKLAPNIRVNGISPGPTLKNKRQSEKHFKAQWRSTILQKQVDLDNICASVKYFIENNSITGQIVSVDSGQSLAWKTPDIINSKE